MMEQERTLSRFTEAAQPSALSGGEVDEIVVTQRNQMRAVI
jgi:hypothetical protein